MAFFGLLFFGMELFYYVHALQIKNIDMNDILAYIDRYKSVQQRGSNRAPTSLKDDNDDLEHLVQNFDYNKDNKYSYLKKYDFLDEYSKDEMYNYNKNENISPSLKSLVKKYNSLYKNKVKKVADFNKKGSQELHDLVPGGNNDYSKLYVILDPKVDLSKSASKDIAKLISSLLSKSGTSKKSKVSDHSRKIQNYKGFAIKDNRRRIKESKEIFASKDSIERDYKPKRGRADYGGGGRTAIPYIRHRGDIYERE